jgi:hypothetical protein
MREALIENLPQPQALEAASPPDDSPPSSDDGRE